MDESLARRRFLLLALLRFSGVALFILGALVLQRRIDLPAPAGTVLALAGIFEALLLPVLIARRWKSSRR